MTPDFHALRVRTASFSEERRAYAAHVASAEELVRLARARLAAANLIAESNPSPTALAAVAVANIEVELALYRYRAVSQKHLTLIQRGVPRDH